MCYGNILVWYSFSGTMMWGEDGKCFSYGKQQPYYSQYVATKQRTFTQNKQLRSLVA